MFKLLWFVRVNPFLMPTPKENKVLWIIFSEVIHFFFFWHFPAIYALLLLFEIFIVLLQPINIHQILRPQTFMVLVLRPHLLRKQKTLGTRSDKINVHMPISIMTYQNPQVFFQQQHGLT